MSRSQRPRHSKNRNRPAAAPDARSIRVVINGAVITITVEAALPGPCVSSSLGAVGTVASFVAAWSSGHTAFPLLPCRSVDLHAAYLRWCRTSAVERPLSANMFLAQVGRLKGWTNRSCHVAVGAVVKRMRIVEPERSLLERAGTAPAAGVLLADWLGDGVRRFREALR